MPNNPNELPKKARKAQSDLLYRYRVEGIPAEVPCTGKNRSRRYTFGILKIRERNGEMVSCAIEY